MIHTVTKDEFKEIFPKIADAFLLSVTDRSKRVPDQLKEEGCTFSIFSTAIDIYGGRVYFFGGIFQLLPMVSAILGEVNVLSLFYTDLKGAQAVKELDDYARYAATKL